jgi:hypothetical protein
MLKHVLFIFVCIPHNFGGNKMERKLVTQEELNKIINEEILRRGLQECKTVGVSMRKNEDIDESGCNWQALGLFSHTGNAVSDKTLEIYQKIKTDLKEKYNLIPS